MKHFRYKCHAGDLEALIYCAQEYQGTVGGGSCIRNLKKEATDYLIVNVFMQFVTHTIKKSKLESFELSAQKMGRMICEVREKGKQKLIVYTCEALFSKTNSNYFTFER